MTCESVDEAGLVLATRTPFPLSKCELTNAQSLRSVEATSRRSHDFDDDQRFGGMRRAIVRIPVSEARACCAWLELRLPSEPEWEYALRAETRTPYWFGDSGAELARHK